MLTLKDDAVTIPKQKPQKPKQYTTATEKKVFISNLRLAVKYYGKYYLRRIFKVTKGKVLHDYMRH